MSIVFHILSDALLQHDSKVTEPVNFGMFCVMALPPSALALDSWTYQCARSQTALLDYGGAF